MPNSPKFKMANLSGANPYGPYWAKHAGSRRDNCYRVHLIEGDESKKVTNETWLELFNTLGEMGYLFQDAGHSSEFLAIFLDKAISEEHIKIMEEQLKLAPIPSGTSDLAFC